MGGRRVLWGPGLTKPPLGTAEGSGEAGGAGGGRREETEAGQCQTRPGCRECPEWPQPSVPCMSPRLLWQLLTSQKTPAVVVQQGPFSGQDVPLRFGNYPCALGTPDESLLETLGYFHVVLRVSLCRSLWEGTVTGALWGTEGPACPSEDKRWDGRAALVW